MVIKYRCVKCRNVQEEKAECKACGGMEFNTIRVHGLNPRRIVVDTQKPKIGGNG